jgi:uncharacterized protein (DUF2132 family)
MDDATKIRAVYESMLLEFIETTAWTREMFDDLYCTTLVKLSEQERCINGTKLTHVIEHFLENEMSLMEHELHFLLSLRLTFEGRILASAGEKCEACTDESVHIKLKGG